MLISSPLEQFATVPLIPIWIGNLYLSFTNSSFFMLLSNDLVINQTFICILSLIFFHALLKYQKEGGKQRIDISMYYCFILYKNALFSIYIFNIFIAIITFFAFDPTLTAHATDGSGEGKGMHIPQPVCDGFKRLGEMGATVAAPIGMGFMIAKAATAVPGPQKALVVGGALVTAFVVDGIVKVKNNERAQPGSGVNQLVSFISDSTPTPVSDEVPVSNGVNSAISSIDSLLFLTNAGLVLTFVIILFILLILFNLLKDEILARLKFLWIFQKYPQVLKWLATSSKWLQVGCCLILFYACYGLYQIFSSDLFILNKIKNILHNL